MGIREAVIYMSFINETIFKLPTSALLNQILGSLQVSNYYCDLVASYNVFVLFDRGLGGFERGTYPALWGLVGLTAYPVTVAPPWWRKGIILKAHPIGSSGTTYCRFLTYQISDTNIWIYFEPLPVE